MLSEEKQAINRLKLLNRELYIDNCNLVNVNDLSTVLNLIAKLQKENEKIKKENEELKQENKRIKYFSSNLFIDDYIPKRVIKNKIKEKQDKINKLHSASDCVIIDDLENEISVLQELLGGQVV